MKIKKYLNLYIYPVQSGNNNVLKDMKRGHTSEIFMDVVKKLRDKFHRFTISTDIIVGFPTESEEQFLDTIKLIKKIKPDIINLSKYSRRRGTKSFNLEQINDNEIKRRSRIAYKVANELSLENNNKWIGWKGEVLFDENTDRGLRGRNFAYKPILIKDHTAKVGQTANVKITHATCHCLIAEIN